MKHYIKLLAICPDNFGSYIIDEQNTIDKDEIVDFIKMYNNIKGIKVFVFQMHTYSIGTFCDVKKYIHTISAFDYIRKLIEESDNILVINHVKEKSTDFIHEFMM